MLVEIIFDLEYDDVSDVVIEAGGGENKHYFNNYKLTYCTRLPGVPRLAGALERTQARLGALAAILTGLTLALVDVHTAVQSRRA